nr:zeta toxin family protein [Streptococcus lutetiensis]
MNLEDKYLQYAKDNKDEFIKKLVHGKVSDDERDAVFMAGSPGAGKTELVTELIKNYDNLVVIDADIFRTMFVDYNGRNSSLFQKASSWLVEQAFQFVVKNGYSFIMDATFAVPSAEKKIIRSLKNNYQVLIFYVYQEPEIAWKFTKAREITEGRLVPKLTFINAFFKARENVKKVKERHPEVTLHVIIKDYQNNISEVHYDTDNLGLIIPQRYRIEDLEEILND